MKSDSKRTRPTHALKLKVQPNNEKKDQGQKNGHYSAYGHNSEGDKNVQI